MEDFIIINKKKYKIDLNQLNCRDLEKQLILLMDFKDLKFKLNGKEIEVEAKTSIGITRATLPAVEWIEASVEQEVVYSTPTITPQSTIPAQPIYKPVHKVVTEEEYINKLNVDNKLQIIQTGLTMEQYDKYIKISYNYSKASTVSNKIKYKLQLNKINKIKKHNRKILRLMKGL